MEAVNDVGGGNNCELAKRIASNHPAGTHTKLVHCSIISNTLNLALLLKIILKLVHMLINKC